jgi:hypothetical protein
MSTFLDFNSTSSFRNFLIGRTLQQPNGPQTFNATNYTVQNLSNFPNIDPGTVEDRRGTELLQTQTLNIYKPTTYFIKDTIDTLPRRVNLSLYPYFTSERHNLIGIMSTGNYDTESELFKFAASYIRDKDQKGPVYARIAQNLYTATSGRVRLLDALNGNTSTAINLLTGREPLIDPNYKITTAKTLPGKGIDFLQTVSGVEFPFSEIPGDYLSNPSNPINYRPQASTEGGRLLQDITGALGSLVGIQRRPKLDRKPSDLLIEYTSEGQKKTLFNLLSFSKYAPNYTTTARSQNTSKVFNFIDTVAQGVKNVLGVEAPLGIAYIGDDRGNDVKYAINDFNDRPVRSNFYLSLMFDESSARLLQRNKNISEGGSTSGGITWISKNSKNKLYRKEITIGKSTGSGETIISYRRSQPDDLVEQSISTKHTFREDSILGVTQELLNSMPSNGGESRSHVANVIDQTSRVFKEGDVKMSRGSAIKYVNKQGEESGVEYCRVWTKDYSYYSMADTMKRTENIRKYKGSVMSKPWNLNIGPISNGKYDPTGKNAFGDSTNIFSKTTGGSDYYAKKYMFSIENLAWKMSNKEGFRVIDLPYCERGSNGGRVMWFPPYDLKVTESSTARWNENSFLGRPEPVYTYENSSRSGNITFKVIVDHPSILNLLVRDYFKDMSDEESDNYINAFFAGCEEVDFFDLIKKYTTLTPDDVNLIQSYLNNGVNTEEIDEFRNEIEEVKKEIPSSGVDNDKQNEELDVTLIFENDIPKKNPNISTTKTYTKAYKNFLGDYNSNKNELQTSVTNLLEIYDNNKNISKVNNDLKLLTSFPINFNKTPKPSLINKIVKELDDTFEKLDNSFKEYEEKLDSIKKKIIDGKLSEIEIDVHSSTSILNYEEKNYNFKLSYRRSYSILLDVFNRLSKSGVGNINVLKWPSKVNETGKFQKTGITFKDFGYDLEGKIIINVHNYGENDTADDTLGSKKCNTGKFEYSTKLSVVAPISVKCRHSKVVIKTRGIKEQPKTITERKSKIIQTKKTVTTQKKKPSIDVMKRIVMKTLSECFYFKKLEETSPIIFSSLKEKLKYFHPAFHSMTPEGLNARLTFLQQCLRPGDTMPIKGISDINDLNARNTTFGPPPVCVLRIGDFYNSKILIENIAISLEDNIWDLNPEGIGVQPMMANVTLQVKFIGGQGLEKPVERLQNALSSNFYANTEMYDERSIITNGTGYGEIKSGYTKSFLEAINEKKPLNGKIEPNQNNVENIVKGKFIGLYTQNLLTPTTGGTLGYDLIVRVLNTNTTEYFKTYQDYFKNIYNSYGSEITSLIFSSNYRKTYQYDVFKTPAGSPTTIELLGNYKKGNELSNYLELLKKKLISDITSVNSITNDVLNVKINSNLFKKSDGYLIPFFIQEIGNVIDGISNKIIGIEDSRNKLLTTLDKINFIVYHEHDAKVDETKYNKVELIGFTSNKLYDECSQYIDYIETNHKILTEKIDTSVNFNEMLNITNNQSIVIISKLLYSQKQKILDLYKQDTESFKQNVEIVEISKSLDKFLKKSDSSKIIFKLKKQPTPKITNLTFTIGSSSEVTDTTEQEKIKKIFSDNVPSIDKLNYYKTPNK